MMTRIWQHFEQKISPILLDSNDTPASTDIDVTANIFDDVADSLLTSCENVPSTEVRCLYQSYGVLHTY